MSANTIRRKYGRSLVGLSKYSSLIAWAIIGAYLGQIFFCVLLGSWLIQGDLSLLTAILIILIQIVIATRLRALNNIVHECSHATFALDRSANEVMGRFCSSLTLGSFTDYRDEHLTHHMHLGDRQKDRDFKSIEDLRLEQPLTGSVLLRHLVTPFLGRHLPYYVKIDLGARDGRVYQALKMSLLFMAVAFSVVSPLTGVFFVVLPYLFFYSTLNYWADCMDHAGLISSSDDLNASRNMAAPSWLSWLLFPRNDSFHLVHHLFPQVPARHLRATHELLKLDPEYAALPNAVPRGARSKPATTAVGPDHAQA